MDCSLLLLWICYLCLANCQPALPTNLTQAVRAPKAADEIGCKPLDGSVYEGKKTTTVTGKTCKTWNAFGLTGHNYCRNPYEIMETVWCYTPPDNMMELCDVPDCVLKASKDYKGRAKSMHLITYCLVPVLWPSAYCRLETGQEIKEALHFFL